MRAFILVIGLMFLAGCGQDKPQPKAPSAQGVAVTVPKITVKATGTFTPAPKKEDRQ